jgi:uncharacterized membrane protein required for colicin V production
MKAVRHEFGSKTNQSTQNEMTAEPPPVVGSHLWQLAFISFAVVLILFEVLRGWNRGIARQLARLGALIAAYFVAFFGGPLVVPLVRPLLNFPDRILSLAAGAALALIIYAVINGLGTLLFKRTKQYDSGTGRVLCGFGGAVLGLFFGGLLVWGLVIGVRSLGSIADGQVREQAANPATAVAAEPRTLHAVDVRRRLAGDVNEEPPSVMTSLARLKNSIELGSVGDVVKKTDPVSENVYATLAKAGQVVSDPQRLQRFLSFPGAQHLSEHPRIIALRGDPEIPEMLQQGRYLELMQNPRVIELLNDPTFTDEIRKFDIKRALDYSLQKN